MNKLAIYITKNYIGLAQMRTGKHNLPEIQEFRLEIADIKEEEIPSRLKAFLKENKINSEYLILGIPRSQASIRCLTLPSADDKEIKNMVEIKLCGLFPYKPEEFIFDQAVIERMADGYSRVMLIMVPGGVIENKLALLKQAGLTPDAIEVSTVSLFNQFCQQKREPRNYLLVNLEDNLLDILLMQKGRFILSRGVSLKQDELDRRIIKEIKEIIDIQSVKDFVVDQIVLSGRGIDLNNLAAIIEQAGLPKTEIDTELWVARGLVLKTGQKGVNVNLLPDRLKMQKNIGIRKRAILYLIVLLVLNISLIGNIAYLKIREKQEYLHFLKSEIKNIESQALGLQKIMHKTRIIRDYSISGKIALGLIIELYRIAPNGIYLSSLEIRGQSPSGKFILSGQAKDTETILKFAALIKGLALIKQTDVNYITKREAQLKEVVGFEILATF